MKLPDTLARGRLAFAAMLFCLSLVACGGGSSDSVGDDTGNNGGNGGGNENDNNSSDTTPPAVTATTPDAGATGIDRRSDITVVFSEDMLSNSISDTSIVLRETEGAALDASVSFNAMTNTATLVSDARLKPLTGYTATVTTAVSDLSGNALAEEHAWTFTSAGREWVGANVIDTYEGGYASFPRIVAGPDGSAFAVWTQQNDDDDASSNDIVLSRYTVANGWSAPELVSVTKPSGTPSIAGDAQGNVTVMWTSYVPETTRIGIYARRRDAASGWEDTQRVDAYTTGSITAPVIAMSREGTAIIAWLYQWGINYRSVQASRYLPGEGWSEPALAGSGGGHANNVRATIDDAGNATVTYAIDWVIYASRLAVDADTWAAKVGLDSNAMYPNIAGNGAGDAYAIWRHNGDGYGDIGVSHYDADSDSWSTPQYLEGVNIGSIPEIAMNESGEAVAVWIDTRGSISGAYTSLFHDGSWSDPELLSLATDTAAQPRVAIRENGNVAATWLQHDGVRYNVYFSTFHVNGFVWPLGAPIEDSDASDYNYLMLACDDDGNVTVAWSSGGASADVFANRYD